MQRFTDYEVWIIDGASTDGTIEFIKTLKAPFKYISEEDSGIYNAMNKGIEKSQGDWLYFLGADDKLYDNNVLNNVLNFASHEDIDLIFGAVEYEIDGEYPFIYSKTKKYKTPSWNWTIWFRNPVHHQATFFRKKLFESREYNTDFKILSDYYLNLSLFKADISYLIYPGFVAKCLSSGVSKKGYWKMYKEEIVLKTKFSTFLLYPFFYLVSVIKYSIAWIIKGKK